MDEESALVILRHMAQEFISLVERERVMYLAGQGGRRRGVPWDDIMMTYMRSHAVTLSHSSALVS